jgi:peptidoglycan/xylan/chitin deacetylase (PgdA/CDA1 family)
LIAGSGPAESYRRTFPHGLMFHRFRSSDDPSRWQGALSPDELEAVLRYVGVENILAPDEWMARLSAGALAETDLCITFDDGLRAQADYALPVLRRHGVRAFWFAYTCVHEGRPVKSEIYSFVAGQIGGMGTMIAEFMERAGPDLLRQLETAEFEAYAQRIRAVGPFYTDDDIRYRFLRNAPRNTDAFEGIMDGIVASHGFGIAELTARLWLTGADLARLDREGHAIGLHSHDHPYEIAKLDAREQRRQYETNYAAIEAATQSKPTCMSHPLNSYDERTLDVLEDLGIRCGFRANAVPPAGRRINPHPLELAREDAANLLSHLRPNASVHL